MLPVLWLLASTAALVSGQSTVTIDPSSVALSTRQAWCDSQKSSCPLLCLQLPGASGSPIANNCSAQTLDYSCICSNNASPNASEYSQTLPYYVCTEANNQCVKRCSDSNCQEDCRSDHPCGAQSPKRVNLTTTSAAAATSTTMSSVLTTSEATGAAPHILTVEKGHIYGLCTLVGGIMGGFALLL